MLCLFRRKMISVVKWFQESHFLKNIFRRKHFSVFVRTENHKYFLYFYSIILTYKNQFLFKTYKY